LTTKCFVCYSKNMKLSNSPFKTSKTRGTDEFRSVEIMFQSGQLKRHSAGVYGFGPLMLRAMNNTASIIRKHLDKCGCVEVSLPLLQAKPLWVESGRFEAYKKADTTFYAKGRDGEYFFSPTAEEFMLDIIRNHVSSYRDLNFNVYQIGHKFRDEIRVRGGLTRGKEFLMKDGYSYSESKEEMEKAYAVMRQCYLDIFTEMGLKAVAVQAINNFGGKVSEEIVAFSDMGVDKILYNEKTGFAINSEVLDDPTTRAIIEEKYGKINPATLVEKTALELGHIFQLEQAYSKTMNLKFTDRTGKPDFCWMGTYGIGVGRAMNVVLEQNCDNDGLVFPLSIAPYKIGIVNLNDAPQTKTAGKLYDFFTNKNIEVIWDDRDLSLGIKIKDMLLCGIPYIVIIGKNQNGDKLEVEVRKTREKKSLTKGELVREVTG